MARIRDAAFLGVIVVGCLAFAGWALRPPLNPPPVPATVPAPLPPDQGPGATAARLNGLFQRDWRRQGIGPTQPADDLTLLRRLALALTGSAPSLEEVRQFEALPRERRVEIWLDHLLDDRRTADYLAERFARAFVGTEDGPFLLFRRRRFTTWLSDAFLANRPYDAIVRDLIADSGLWTDHPATNFVTVTRGQDTERPDPERLAARVSRCFLAERLDCAQCHDHPFEPWTQADFRGLAAFFGGTHANLRGTHDRANDYRPLDRVTNQPVTVAVTPAVPRHPELLPDSGTDRQRLAAWITDPRNPALACATVNRMWALLFGRPLSEPVDDLPPDAEQSDVLRVLAADFARHRYDLHRLIRVIAATRPFRLQSATPEPTGPTDVRMAAWAVFPLTRLRPEQVAGSLYQSASLSTIGPDSSWVVRFFAYTGRNEFVRRYGDTGEDEFDARGGTIPQRLLMMNGELVREKTKGDLFNAASRIAGQAPDDDAAVEVAYLTILTRRPTPEERAHFSARLDGARGDQRVDRIADLIWSMLNSTEYSWNH